ncbi:MAG: type VI secretion system contractile sheath small subunit, partial [bacterium]|nr:type VI secretion system contractile sheath small subunit [bacterium]
MAQSFQKEIPPSRVNIRYVKYTGGAQEEVELPLKLLLLGDYTLREDDT